MLVHLGIDTVRLEGAGFELLVAEKSHGRGRAAGHPLGPLRRRRPRPEPDGHALRARHDSRERSPASALGETVAVGASLFALARHLVTRPRVAALLLDLDGTLVDSEPLHRERYRAWFAQPRLALRRRGRGAVHRPPGRRRLPHRRRAVARRGPRGPARRDHRAGAAASAARAGRRGRRGDRLGARARHPARARHLGRHPVGRPGARGARWHRRVRHDRHPRRHRDRQARPGLLRPGLRAARGGCRCGARLRGRARRRALGRRCRGGGRRRRHDAASRAQQLPDAGATRTLPDLTTLPALLGG